MEGVTVVSHWKVYPTGKADRWSVRLYIDGQRERAFRFQGSRTEAETEAAVRLAREEREGPSFGSSRDTLLTWCRFVINEKPLAESSVADLEDAIARFIDPRPPTEKADRAKWGDLPYDYNLGKKPLYAISLIDGERFKQFLRDRSGRREQRISHAAFRAWMLAHRALRRAADLRVLPIDPWRGLLAPPVVEAENKVRNLPSEDALERLMHLDPSEGFKTHQSPIAETKRERVLMLIKLAYATGARRGELIALDWRHLDLQRGTVRIEGSVSKVSGEVKKPKTDAGYRTIRIREEMVRDLYNWRTTLTKAAWEYARHTGEHVDMNYFPVFPGGVPRGEPLGPKVRWRLTEASLAAARMMERVGMDASLHSLRHVHATDLLGNGQAPAAVASRLGHGDTKVTVTIYGHVQPKDDEKMANIAGGALRRRRA